MGQHCRVTIEKLVHGGTGLGVASGKKIFVANAAPGDVLDVEVTQDHGGWAEAAICAIVHPSPDRVAPRCPVFGRCGGCQWQHLSYDAQLRWKREILRESLARIARIPDAPVLEPLPSPQQWHYRNRIQLHVDSQGRVGFYQPRSKAVVEFEECAIADERLNEELRQRRAEISTRDRGIALRVAGDDVSFSQINTLQNEQLQGVLRQWLLEVPHRTLFELYAGSGNFTFAIAPIVEHIVASDIDGRAIRAARERQLRDGVIHVEFVCAPARGPSRRKSPRESAGRAVRRLGATCDAVLVDPPRGGCAEAVEGIVGAAPRSIFYISCDPATLARDAEALSRHGYRLVRCLPVDMFPQTFHIESLSLFSAKAVSSFEATC